MPRAARPLPARAAGPPAVADLGRLQLMARAVEQVGEGVAVFDEDDVLIYANQVLAAMHGVPADQLEGRHLSTFVPVGDEQRDERARNEAAGVDVVRLEISTEVPGVGPQSVRVTVSPLTDGEGSRIGRVVCVLDITERTALESQLKAAALTDPLTGLPNRRLLSDRLAQALAAARRRHEPLALLYLDLDGFKPVNDRLGHEAGDELLVQVAARLAGCVREGDTLARVGGDEFVALLPRIGDLGQATATADRFLARLGRPFRVGDGPQVAVTASVGVAFAVTGSPRDLLHAADTAMYRAKAAGPGNVVVSGR